MAVMAFPTAHCSVMPQSVSSNDLESDPYHTTQISISLVACCLSILLKLVTQLNKLDDQLITTP